MFAHKYIPPEGIKGLDEYKYVGGAYSWLDLRLNPFWFWCAEQFPQTMAPNLITLIGTAFLMSIAGVIMVFDPYLEGAAPKPAYIWCAISVWVYQTMDAVDGKQARRTNSSSPLGQLFDHGCDALGTMPLALCSCSALGFGPTVWAVIICATIQVPFYMAQYEEHFAHTMRTQVANFGVSEGQYLIIVLLLVTVTLGAKFWDTQVPYTESLVAFVPGPAGQEHVPRLTLRTCALYSGCFFPALLGLASLVTVLRMPQHRFAFLRLIPMILLQLALVWVALGSPSKSGLSGVFQSQPVYFLLSFGVLFTHLANRIIIATVCKIPYPLVEWTVLAPVPFFIFSDDAFRRNRDLQAWLLFAFSLLVYAQYTHFAVSVGQQIARHLKINILSLGRRVE